MTQSSDGCSFVSALRPSRYTVDLKRAPALSQMATTSASLQTAAAALLQALQATGSSATGTLVSTSA